MAAVATLALTACGQTTDAAAPVGAPAKASPQAVSLETAKTPLRHFRSLAPSPPQASRVRSLFRHRQRLHLLSAIPRSPSQSQMQLRPRHSRPTDCGYIRKCHWTVSRDRPTPEEWCALPDSAQHRRPASDRVPDRYRPGRFNHCNKGRRICQHHGQCGNPDRCPNGPMGPSTHRGKALATHYEVSGASVRQVTDLSSAALPVTAGPALVATNADSPSAPYPTGSSAAPLNFNQTRRPSWESFRLRAASPRPTTTTQATPKAKPTSHQQSSAT